eukprot:15322973-Alexandrium_andersonii.AAC.1
MWRPALSRARAATAYPGIGAASWMHPQPAGRTIAMPPGCFGPAAPTMEATVRAPGSTADHSAAV